MTHSVNTAVDEILDLLESSRDMGYFGEPVTQLAHALQSAQLAGEGGSDGELILAALLHDVGHLVAEAHREDVGVVDHDHTGAEYLRDRNFSARVVALVEGHVEAKRYLTAVNPAYLQKLSEASMATLKLQGGPMTAAEIAAFEKDPLFREKLLLRSWDERAKVVDCAAPPLSDYRPLLEAHLSRGQR